MRVSMHAGGDCPAQSAPGGRMVASGCECGKGGMLQLRAYVLDALGSTRRSFGPAVSSSRRA